MGAMRILMLCQRLPYPPTKGEKIRALHHLRWLARTHQVTLVSRVEDPADLRHVGRLQAFAGRVETVLVDPRWAKLKSLASLAGATPLTVRYFFAPALRARVRALLQRQAYDLAFVYSSGMAQYVEEVPDLPVVIDFVDIDSRKWLQYANHAPFPFSLLYRTEAERMKRYEARVATLAEASLFVSRAEAEQFRRDAPWVRAVAVPMVVDTEYFQPVPPPGGQEAPTVVFTGVMDYFPNVEAVRFFATKVFPRIRAREPRTRFLIVGQRPHWRVRRLARIPGVEVTGPVVDVRPYLARAHVAVAPLRIAQGVQTKILEAMAMGLPVVATAKAYDGLEALPGEHLLVEDEPGRLAESVVRLLRTPGLRAALGGAARRFVETHHCWSASMASLDAVLTAVTRQAPALAAGGRG